jgi:hypothetical protein
VVFGTRKCINKLLAAIRPYLMDKKKFTILLLIGSTLINFVTAQPIDKEKIYSNAQGIKQEGIIFYEVEGYDIFVQIQKASFDDKGISKLKRKYSIKSEVVPNVDTSFQNNKKIVTTDNRTSRVIQSNIYYFFPQGQNEIKVIGLQTTNKRDEQLENFFVNSILNNTIPNEVYTSTIVDSIKFGGRYIVLGPACHWMGAHNIQCPNLGQMNWAEFRTMDKAKEMVEAQHDISANKKLGEVLEGQQVDVVFEGTETKALKTRYKIKLPKPIMGGSNVLIIYYVATEVRGKYIGCVLSHYTDDVNAKKLPPLLSEVMKLKE